jgi:REP element-mobilizing transposase RayT
VSFSRKVAVRSLGDARRDAVEAYIERQAAKEAFADDRFRDKVRGFTVVNRDVDLSRPSESRSGRYWYNLHVVLVTLDRTRFSDNQSLTSIRDTALRVAAKKGYSVSRLSVMPDHLHIALRGDIEHSPQDIALAFLNNLAYAMGQNPIWQHVRRVRHGCGAQVLAANLGSLRGSRQAWSIV